MSYSLWASGLGFKAFVKTAKTKRKLSKKQKHKLKVRRWKARRAQQRLAAAKRRRRQDKNGRIKSAEYQALCRARAAKRRFIPAKRPVRPQGPQGSQRLRIIYERLSDGQGEFFPPRRRPVRPIEKPLTQREKEKKAAANAATLVKRKAATPIKKPLTQREKEKKAAANAATLVKRKAATPVEKPVTRQQKLEEAAAMAATINRRPVVAKATARVAKLKELLLHINTSPTARPGDKLKLQQELQKGEQVVSRLKGPQGQPPKEAAQAATPLVAVPQDELLTLDNDEIVNMFIDTLIGKEVSSAEGEAYTIISCGKVSKEFKKEAAARVAAARETVGTASVLSMMMEPAEAVAAEAAKVAARPAKAEAVKTEAARPTKAEPAKVAPVRSISFLQKQLPKAAITKLNCPPGLKPLFFFNHEPRVKNPSEIGIFAVNVMMQGGKFVPCNVNIPSSGFDAGFSDYYQRDQHTQARNNVLSGAAVSAALPYDSSPVTFCVANYCVDGRRGVYIPASYTSLDLGKKTANQQLILDLPGADWTAADGSIPGVVATARQELRDCILHKKEKVIESITVSFDSNGQKQEQEVSAKIRFSKESPSLKEVLADGKRHTLIVVAAFEREAIAFKSKNGEQYRIYPHTAAVLLVEDQDVIFGGQDIFNFCPYDLLGVEKPAAEDAEAKAAKGKAVQGPVQRPAEAEAAAEAAVQLPAVQSSAEVKAAAATEAKAAEAVAEAAEATAAVQRPAVQRSAEVKTAEAAEAATEVKAVAEAEVKAVAEAEVKAAEAEVKAVAEAEVKAVAEAAEAATISQELTALYRAVNLVFDTKRSPMTSEELVALRKKYRHGSIDNNAARVTMDYIHSRTNGNPVQYYQWTPADVEDVLNVLTDCWNKENSTALTFFKTEEGELNITFGGVTSIVISNDGRAYDHAGRCFEQAVEVKGYNELRKKRVLVGRSWRDEEVKVPIVTSLKLASSTGKFMQAFLGFLLMLSNNKNTSREGLGANFSELLLAGDDMFPLTMTETLNQNGGFLHGLQNSLKVLVHRPFNRGIKYTAEQTFRLAHSTATLMRGQPKGSSVKMWLPAGATEPVNVRGVELAQLEECEKGKIVKSLDPSGVEQEAIAIAMRSYKSLGFHFAKGVFLSGITHVSLHLAQQYAPTLFRKMLLAAGLENKTAAEVANYVVSLTLKASKGAKRATLSMAKAVPVKDEVEAGYRYYNQTKLLKGWLVQECMAPTFVMPPGMAFFLGTEEEKPVGYFKKTDRFVFPTYKVGEQLPSAVDLHGKSFYEDNSSLEDCLFGYEPVYSYNEKKAVHSLSFSERPVLTFGTQIAWIPKEEGSWAELAFNQHETADLAEIRWWEVQSVSGKTELAVEYDYYLTHRNPKLRGVQKAMLGSASPDMLYNSMNPELGSLGLGDIKLISPQDTIKSDMLYSWLQVIGNTLRYSNQEADAVKKLQEYKEEIHKQLGVDKGLPYLVIEPYNVVAGLYQEMVDYFEGQFGRAIWMHVADCGDQGRILNELYQRKVKAQVGWVAVPAANWGEQELRLCQTLEAEGKKMEIIAESLDYVNNPKQNAIILVFSNNEVVEYYQRSYCFIGAPGAPVCGVELFESSTVAEAISSSNHMPPSIRSFSRMTGAHADNMFAEAKRLLDEGKESTFMSLAIAGMASGDNFGCSKVIKFVYLKDRKQGIDSLSLAADDISYLKELLSKDGIDNFHHESGLFQRVAHSLREVVFDIEGQKVWLPVLFAIAALKTENRTNNISQIFFRDILISCLEGNVPTTLEAKRVEGILENLCDSKKTRQLVSAAGNVSAKRIALPHIPTGEVWVLYSDAPNSVCQQLKRSGFDVDRIMTGAVTVFTHNSRAPLTDGPILKLKVITDSENQANFYRLNADVLALSPMGNAMDFGDFDGDGHYLLQLEGQFSATSFEDNVSFVGNAIGYPMFDVFTNTPGIANEAYAADHYNIKSWKKVAMTLSGMPAVLKDHKKKVVLPLEEYITFNQRAREIQAKAVGIAYSIFMWSEHLVDILIAAKKLGIKAGWAFEANAANADLVAPVSQLYEIILGGFSNSAWTVYDRYLRGMKEGERTVTRDNLEQFNADIEALGVAGDKKQGFYCLVTAAHQLFFLERYGMFCDYHLPEGATQPLKVEIPEILEQMLSVSLVSFELLRGKFAGFKGVLADDNNPKTAGHMVALRKAREFLDNHPQMVEHSLVCYQLHQILEECSWLLSDHERGGSPALVKDHQLGYFLDKVAPAGETVTPPLLDQAEEGKELAKQLMAVLSDSSKEILKQLVSDWGISLPDSPAEELSVLIAVELAENVEFYSSEENIVPAVREFLTKYKNEAEAHKAPLPEIESVKHEEKEVLAATTLKETDNDDQEGGTPIRVQRPSGSGGGGAAVATPVAQSKEPAPDSPTLSKEGSTSTARPSETVFAFKRLTGGVEYYSEWLNRLDEEEVTPSCNVISITETDKQSKEACLVLGRKWRESWERLVSTPENWGLCTEFKTKPGEDTYATLHFLPSSKFKLRDQRDEFLDSFKQTSFELYENSSMILLVKAMFESGDILKFWLGERGEWSTDEYVFTKLIKRLEYNRQTTAKDYGLIGFEYDSDGQSHVVELDPSDHFGPCKTWNWEDVLIKDIGQKVEEWYADYGVPSDAKDHLGAQLLLSYISQRWEEEKGLYTQVDCNTQSETTLETIIKQVKTLPADKWVDVLTYVRGLVAEVNAAPAVVETPVEETDDNVDPEPDIRPASNRWLERLGSFTRPPRTTTKNSSSGLSPESPVTANRPSSNTGKAAVAASVAESPSRADEQFVAPAQATVVESNSLDWLTAYTSSLQAGVGEQISRILEGLNPEQQNAVRLILGGGNYILTGDAGTGKSHTSSASIEILKLLGYKIVPVATTGLASLSLLDSQGTINRATGVGTGFSKGTKTWDEARELVNKINNPKVKKRFAEEGSNGVVFLIDEVSMLDTHLGYVIAKALEIIQRDARDKGKPRKRPIQWLCVGDFKQLEPVGGDMIMSPAIFDNNGSTKGNISLIDLLGLKLINLKQQMRQSGDTAFADELHALALGKGGTNLENCPLIKSRFKASMKEMPEDALHVFALNDELNQFNAKKLRELKEKGNKSKTYTAHVKPFDCSKEELLKFVAPIPERLELAVGAPIRVKQNIEDPSSKGNLLVANGSRGTVVNLHNDSIEVLLRDGRTVKIRMVNIHVPKNENNQPIGAFTQIPVCLAWGTTFHGCQGMTEDKIVIHAYTREGGRATGQIKAMFSNNAFYVGCSRVRRVEDLYFYTGCDEVDLTTETSDEYRQREYLYRGIMVRSYRTNMSVIQWLEEQAVW